MLVDNGCLVAVGGADIDETIEEYNIAENTWTIKEEVAGAFFMMGSHLLPELKITFFLFDNPFFYEISDQWQPIVL